MLPEGVAGVTNFEPEVRGVLEVVREKTAGLEATDPGT